VILSLCAASAILSLNAYSALGLARTALYFLSTEGVYTRFPASVRITSTLCAFAALFFVELYDGRIHLVHHNNNTSVHRSSAVLTASS
jgi:predicted DNA-binding transcriptional regulator AlpA